MSVKEHIERLARVRELVGSDFNIACDANQAWHSHEEIVFSVWLKR